MIRLIAIAMLAATPVSGAEMAFRVGNFDRVSLGGSPDVTVTTGRAVTVQASGEQRALDRLDIRVEAGTLKIGTKPGFRLSWNDGGRVRIAVTVPMVRGVEVGGSGSVNIDRVKTPSFGAEIGGSGSIDVAALDTQRATFSVAGSGKASAAGRCDSVAIEIAGSGKLQLDRLRCATLDATIAGSGDIAAYASRTAAVSVMGSGDVRVAGGAKCAVTKRGSGSVVCTG